MFLSLALARDQVRENQKKMLADYAAGLHVQQLQASQWKQPHEAIRIRQLLDKPVASLDGLSIDRLGYDTRLARRHAKDHWSDSDEEDGRFSRPPTADQEADEWDDSLEGKQRRTLRTAADARFARAPCLLYTSPSPRDQRGSRMPSSA